MRVYYVNGWMLVCLCVCARVKLGDGRDYQDRLQYRFIYLVTSELLAAPFCLLSYPSVHPTTGKMRNI